MPALTRRAGEKRVQTYFERWMAQRGAKKTAWRWAGDRLKEAAGDAARALADQNRSAWEDEVSVRKDRYWLAEGSADGPRFSLYIGSHRRGQHNKTEADYIAGFDGRIWLAEVKEVFTPRTAAHALGQALVYGWLLRVDDRLTNPLQLAVVFGEVPPGGTVGGKYSEGELFLNSFAKVFWEEYEVRTFLMRGPMSFEEFPVSVPNSEKVTGDFR